jgi:hypothetical protein
MPFRDDIHAAHARAEQLEEQNRELRDQLRLARQSFVPAKRSNIGYSVGIVAATLVALTGVVGAAMLVLGGRDRAQTHADRKASVPLLLAAPDASFDDGLGTGAATLRIEDVTLGVGKEASNGDKLTVHYVGTLLDGTRFDTSRERGRPFTFTLGRGTVIKGWEQGLLGMRAGGRRKLTIPAPLAYGARAMPSIPANATLQFDVELLTIEPQP